jgi:hypothetical protein
MLLIRVHITVLLSARSVAGPTHSPIDAVSQGGCMFLPLFDSSNMSSPEYADIRNPPLPMCLYKLPSYDDLEAIHPGPARACDACQVVASWCHQSMPVLESVLWLSNSEVMFTLIRPWDSRKHQSAGRCSSESQLHRSMLLPANRSPELSLLSAYLGILAVSLPVRPFTYQGRTLLRQACPLSCQRAVSCRLRNRTLCRPRPCRNILEQK